GMGGIFTEAFKDVVFKILPVEEIDAIQMIESLKYSKILMEGFRNIPAVSKKMLVDIILKTAKMAYDLSGEVDSFDINPIIAWGNQYRVVDFKYISSSLKERENNNKIDITGIDRFFKAKSIAVIGATKNTERIGYLVLDNVMNHGYEGKVFPINPNYDEIMGIKCYSSILEVSDKIDLAVITTSLSQVPMILEQCRKKRISNLIIISAGGKEIGEFELEEKIKKIASNYKIRIIGCNCLGVFDSKNHIDTLFQPYNKMNRPGNGTISLISQSGTVGIAALELLTEYGVSKFVSYGNRIDVDEGDLITYLADDSSTRVIGVYIEGLEKGKKFFEAAKNTTNRKPIIVYKAGRTPEAIKAAMSHTGSLTGTYDLIRGVMDQAHIIQVDNFESFIASLKTLSLYKKASGNKVMIITNGAGVTIQAIDRIFSKNKLKFSNLSNDSKKLLLEILPKHVIIGNPIDLTGTATNQQYEVAIRTAINDENVSVILIWFVFQCKPITADICYILQKYSKVKPIICGTIGSDYTYEIAKLIEEKKVPVFHSVEEWVSATEALCLS
ncbi:MAG: acyl-CoA synthetase, partial [Actinobacteria bacterium]|nr:acyl-CoA synthetase [Actinomycetota bacterium]